MDGRRASRQRGPLEDASLRIEHVDAYGVGGIEIAVGKLNVYTAAAGINHLPADQLDIFLQAFRGAFRPGTGAP